MDAAVRHHRQVLRPFRRLKAGPYGRGPAVTECEQSGDRHVDLPFDPRSGEDLDRLAQDPPRNADRVATDVEQRAAAKWCLQPDVVGVFDRESEARLHVDRIAQLLDKGSHRGMKPVHEGLHQVLARGLRGGRHLLRLGRVHRERLFAQHVLARLERAQRPLLVQVVGQRVVDDIDLRVGEQRLIRLDHAGVGVGRKHLARTFPAATRHSHEPAVAGSRNRREHRAAGNVRRPEHAPAEVLGYMSTCNCAPPRAIDSVAAAITATVRRASSAVTAIGSSHARWSARFR